MSSKVSSRIDITFVVSTFPLRMSHLQDGDRNEIRCKTVWKEMERYGTMEGLLSSILHKYYEYTLMNMIIYILIYLLLYLYDIL